MVAHRVQLLAHGVHRGGGDGGAVPDHDLRVGSEEDIDKSGIRT